MEIWKPIPSEPDYSVSNLGNFRRETDGRQTYKKRPLKAHLNKVTGYLNVTLSRTAKRKSPRTFAAHRLVAETWLPNPENLPCVFHLNKDKTDNRAENLKWATYKEIAVSNPTYVKNLTTGEILEFSSGVEVAKHFKVSKGLIGHHIKNGKEFRGHSIWSQKENSDKTN